MKNLANGRKRNILVLDLGKIKWLPSSVFLWSLLFWWWDSNSTLSTKENILEYFNEQIIWSHLCQRHLWKPSSGRERQREWSPPKHSLPNKIPYRKDPQSILRSKSMLDRRKSTRVILSCQSRWAQNLASSGQSAILVSIISCRWSSVFLFWSPLTSKNSHHPQLAFGLNMWFGFAGVEKIINLFHTHT